MARYILNKPKLVEWKERERRTFAWLAETAQIHLPTFYQQISGACGASLRLAMSLHRVTGIPVEDLVIEKAC